MSTYILVDGLNLFYRARHSVRGDIDMQLGMSMHITLSSIKKAWFDFGGDHVIFCTEGRSWRKDYYPRYKRNRKEVQKARTPKEQEEDELFFEVFNEFQEFVKEKTNCTYLQHPQLEADDLIAGWIQSHPGDNHIIVSTDSDFVQLIATNVKQYNGVTGVTTTHDGFYDDRGKRVKDRKTGKEKPAPDPEWLLFEKCIRGDQSDNIFSAYPGVRKKGSKNKTGMIEAFEDRNNKGFTWNNFMLQKWADHEGVEHRVLDDYQRNVQLIDLTAQPDDIKEVIVDTILGVEPKQVPQVGVNLMKFCAKWRLQRVSDQAESFAKPLTARYPK